MDDLPRRGSGGLCLATDSQPRRRPAEKDAGAEEATAVGHHVYASAPRVLGRTSAPCSSALRSISDQAYNARRKKGHVVQPEHDLTGRAWPGSRGLRYGIGNA